MSEPISFVEAGHPHMTISTGQPVTSVIRIYRPDTGDMLVNILPDGTLEYGETYDPDEAARVFWEALARRGASDG